MSRGPYFLKLLPPSAGIHASNDQTLPIRAHFKFGIWIDLEQVQNRAVDNQSQAISVFGELLRHNLSVYPMYHHLRPIVSLRKYADWHTIWHPVCTSL